MLLLRKVTIEVKKVTWIVTDIVVVALASGVRAQVCTLAIWIAFFLDQSFYLQSSTVHDCHNFDKFSALSFSVSKHKTTAV